MALWRRRRDDGRYTVPATGATAPDSPLMREFIAHFGKAATDAHRGGDSERMSMAMLAASVDIDDLTGFAEQGDPDAAYALAIALQVQHPRRKKAKAAHWLRTAAEAGNTNAVYDLGQEYYLAGGPEAALPWFQRAADAGDDTAAEVAANLLLTVGRWEEAMPYARQAAVAQEPHPAALLGDHLRNTSDLAGARTWYLIAQRAGDATATTKLANLPVADGHQTETEH